MIIQGKIIRSENGKWIKRIDEDLYFPPNSTIYLGKLDSPINYEEVEEGPQKEDNETTEEQQ